MSAAWTEPSDRYGWSAVFRNLALFFFPVALAPALYAVSPFAPWLLAPLIGLAAYRLTVVMHDCIHRTLFKDAPLNAAIGRWLGALTGVDFRRFATQHLRHHRSYGEAGDPQGFHYLGLHGLNRAELAWHLLKPLLGFNLRYAWRETFLHPANLRKAELLPLALMQTLIAATVTGGGAYWWLAPLPFVSAATFGLFFSQLRGIAEHAAMGDTAPAGHVRSHSSSWLDRALLYDLNFNYHLEHHRHPQYASCHLAAVHRQARTPAAAGMFRTIASLARR